MKKFVFWSLALLLVLACGAVNQVPVPQPSPVVIVITATNAPAASPTQQVVVVTATPLPATPSPYPTYTPYPTNTPYPTVHPSDTPKAFMFVSAFIHMNNVPGCGYYITGGGFQANLNMVLKTVISGYAPVLTKIKSDANGRFSYRIVTNFPLGFYAGLRITTTAYDTGGNLLADAVETVPNKCG